MPVKRVLLLVLKGAEMYEMAALYDVLGWASAEGAEPIEVTTVGLQPEVRCTFGLRVRVDQTIIDVDPDRFDALALPGGFEEHGYYEEAYSQPTLDLIRSFSDRPIASICVGALPIARSGLLHERPATTYCRGGSVRRDQLAAMGAAVVDETIVHDGDITTSTGPGTAIEVALHLLGRLTGQANADHIRHLMGFDSRE
jgi:4-methyl-5(b-hydroxyethyl)-thiazole monophosphate biosynthesis